MPNYKGHLVGALFCYVVTIFGLALTTWSFPVLMQALIFTCLGSLFPDIDTKSKGQKIFYFFGVIAVILLIMQQRYHLVACISVLGFVPLLVRHRGIFHNIWFCTLLVGGFVAVCSHIFPIHSQSILRNGLFFFLGLFSHLVLDFGLRRVLKFR